MFNKDVILVDSKAAIQDISFENTTTEKECSKIILFFEDTSKEIVFKWIFSHCDIAENKKAN